MKHFCCCCLFISLSSDIRFRSLLSILWSFFIESIDKSSSFSIILLIKLLMKITSWRSFYDDYNADSKHRFAINYNLMDFVEGCLNIYFNAECRCPEGGALWRKVEEKKPTSKWRIRGNRNVIQISIDSFMKQMLRKGQYIFLSPSSSHFIMAERWNSIHSLRISRSISLSPSFPSFW